MSHNVPVTVKNELTCTRTSSTESSRCTPLLQTLHASPVFRPHLTTVFEEFQTAVCRSTQVTGPHFVCVCVCWGGGGGRGAEWGGGRGTSRGSNLCMTIGASFPVVAMVVVAVVFAGNVACKSRLVVLPVQWTVHQPQGGSVLVCSRQCTTGTL